jgi:hypothetical protein
VSERYFYFYFFFLPFKLNLPSLCSANSPLWFYNLICQPWAADPLFCTWWATTCPTACCLPRALTWLPAAAARLDLLFLNGVLPPISYLLPCSVCFRRHGGKERETNFFFHVFGDERRVACWDLPECLTAAGVGVL